MVKYLGTNRSDVLTQDDLAHVSIYGYGGADRITLNLIDQDGGFNYVDAGTGNDKVVNYFEGGNDIFLGAGNDLYIADIRAGNSSDYDVVSGGAGNDRFEVNTEASVYKGDAGDDTFLTVGYNNSFYGGAGIDTISYELQDAYASERGKGVTIDLGKGTAFTSSSQTEDLYSIENATGTLSSDDITGTSGRNILKGLDGNDVIFGLGGDDDLYGGSGNDDLTGGSGSDDLYGGSGADIFYFDDIRDSVVGSRRDYIMDFRASEDDLVDLSRIDANTRLSGNQDFTFIGKASFDGHAGELRFANGILSGDVNGDGRADFEIKMVGINKMYADDFIL